MFRAVDEIHGRLQLRHCPISGRRARGPRRRGAVDRLTLLGMAGLIALIVWVMISGTGRNVAVFWRTPSIALVIGGAVLVTLISCPRGQLRQVLAMVRKAVNPREPGAGDTAMTLVALAAIARREGLLALDARVKRIDDPFLQRAMFMAIDGADPGTIEKVMITELESTRQRHAEGRGLIETMGRSAPALGMIGTLIGLVIMVGAMDSPARIGPGMAIALLTTLYGLVFAHAFCWPLARKLAHHSRAELLRKTVVIEGVLAIQAGDHPRMVEQKVRAHLPEAIFGRTARGADPAGETGESPAARDPDDEQERAEVPAAEQKRTSPPFVEAA